MQIAVGVDIGCDGSFVIDAIGIHSTEPIIYDSAYWDGTTLIIKSVNCNNTAASVNNLSYSEYFTNLLSKIFSKQDVDLPSRSPTYVEKRDFSVTWAERGIVNPTVTSVNLSGDVHINITIHTSNCVVNLQDGTSFIMNS